MIVRNTRGKIIVNNKHIEKKVLPDSNKCAVCTIIISGEFAYNRSNINTQLCNHCDGSLNSANKD